MDDNEKREEQRRALDEAKQRFNEALADAGLNPPMLGGPVDLNDPAALAATVAAMALTAPAVAARFGLALLIATLNHPLPGKGPANIADAIADAVAAGENGENLAHLTGNLIIGSALGFTVHWDENDEKAIAEGCPCPVHENGRPPLPEELAAETARVLSEATDGEEGFRRFVESYRKWRNRQGRPLISPEAAALNALLDLDADLPDDHPER